MQTITAETATKSFLQDTGKRKGATFFEDGEWWGIGADGHQWCLVDGEWTRFTDDDDEHAREVATEKRYAAEARRKAA